MYTPLLQTFEVYVLFLMKLRWSKKKDFHERNSKHGPVEKFEGKRLQREGAVDNKALQKQRKASK